MDLYFAPLACSLSARIAAYEANAPIQFHQVDTKAKRVLDDTADFLALNSQGQVPVLKLDSGDLLTENPAVLQAIADAHPKAGLVPASGIDRYRVQQWLNFVTSELHKFVFIALLDPKAPEGAKQYARDKAVPRFDYLNTHLTGRDFLTDRFTIADAYLVTILNWAAPSGIDLSKWPAVASYYQRMHARPAVAKSFAEELALYREEQARQKAA
jgi:glutathione S-transferase